MNLISLALKVWKRLATGQQPVDAPTPSALKEANALIRDAKDKERYGYKIDRRRLEEGCMSAMHVLNTEIEIIEGRIANGGEGFAREYAAWYGQRPENPSPRVIPEAIAKGRRYSLAAAASALLEIILAIFVLTGIGADPVTASISSAVITSLLLLLAHGTIAEATERPSPQHSRDLIKKYVFKPALALTVPALCVVLFARILSDISEWLLPIFLPVLQGSLWGATLGLILLGGSLFALADLYRWSERHAGNIDHLHRLKAQLENRRAYYHSFIPVKQEEAGEPPPAAQRAKEDAHASLRVVVSGLLVFTCLFAGCSGAGARQEAKSIAPTGQPRTPGELHFEIDASGSTERAALEEAARNLHAQLPELIEASWAQLMTISHFGADGWSVPPALSVKLPQRKRPELEPARMKAGEAAGLPGVRASVDKANRLKEKEAIQQADEKYEADMSKVLGDIGPAMLMPKAGAKASCTDLYGVLLRIASRRHRGPHFYVILTDGYHTCGGNPPSAAPQGEVRVLVLLTPARGREGEGKRPAEQFASRRDALQKAVPWLVIAPAFESSNLSDYLQVAGK